MCVGKFVGNYKKGPGFFKVLLKRLISNFNMESIMK